MLANAKAMAKAFVEKGYKVVSGGTDNHSMLIDLRTKFPELTGKKAENTLVKADITINKNMVPFDTRTPFSTSGLRVGTPAITTRGLKEEHMPIIVDMIDRVLSAPDDETVIAQVKERSKRHDERQTYVRLVIRLSKYTKRPQHGLRSFLFVN